MFSICFQQYTLLMPVLKVMSFTIIDGERVFATPTSKNAENCCMPG